LVPLIVAVLYLIAGVRLLRGRVFFAPPVK
jgi:hypothetical protein